MLCRAACMCAFFNGIMNISLTRAAVGRQEGQRLQILIRVHLCMCCASAALRKYLSNQLLELELVFVTNTPLTLPFKNSHVETPERMRHCGGSSRCNACHTERTASRAVGHRRDRAALPDERQPSARSGDVSGGCDV